MPSGFPVEIVLIDVNGKSVEAKACTTCCQVKPLESFYRNKLGVGGRNARCKSCESAAKRVYRQVNKDKERERHKRYRTENYEKCKKASYKWAKENPNAVSAIQHRKRARERSLPATITAEELDDILLYFNGRCALSGASDDVVWDHFITLSTGKVGSTKQNMIPVSSFLNKSKGDQNPITWFQKEKERLNLSEERFNSVIAYLAQANAMSVDEYVGFVYECYKNCNEETEVSA